MNLLNICAALHKLNVMLGNSKSPKSAQIAAFGMPSGSYREFRKRLGQMQGHENEAVYQWMRKDIDEWISRAFIRHKASIRCLALGPYGVVMTISHRNVYKYLVPFFATASFWGDRGHSFEKIAEGSVYMVLHIVINRLGKATLTSDIAIFSEEYESSTVSLKIIRTVSFVQAEIFPDDCGVHQQPIMTLRVCAEGMRMLMRAKTNRHVNVRRNPWLTSTCL